MHLLDLLVLLGRSLPLGPLLLLVLSLLLGLLLPLVPLGRLLLLQKQVENLLKYLVCLKDCLSQNDIKNHYRTINLLVHMVYLLQNL